MFYVYAYVDPRYESVEICGVQFPGQPFYIGKGKDKRAWVHLSESRHRTHNTLKYDKIQRIRHAGEEPIVMMVMQDLSETDALALEQQWIKAIGTKWTVSNVKRGPLCNMTSGGEGVVPAEELKQKFVHYGADNGMYGRTHTAEAKARISAFRSTFRHTEETRKAMSARRSSSANPHNKSWNVMLPTGEVVVTSHLRTFCKEHNINYNTLYNCYKKDKPMQQGYRLIGKVSASSTDSECDCV